MVEVACNLCGAVDASIPVGSGRDFEYDVTDDTFLAHRCVRCDLVYLNPRPSTDEFGRIYPDTYHAFEFDPESYGLVHRLRRLVEARRMLRWAAGAPADARILDVGCGDGFHLEVLRDFGRDTWRLEGIDADERGVERARSQGLDVRQGFVGSIELTDGAYDLMICLQTVEHVADPVGFVGELARALKPGGKLVIVTDNTRTLDFRLAGRRYWGGYHFPRHWNLFSRRSIGLLAQRAGLDVERVTTQVSPVNWTYSVRNALQDRGVSGSALELFSLTSAPAMAAFTLLDLLFLATGNGALLQAHLRRPA